MEEKSRCSAPLCDVPTMVTVSRSFLTVGTAPARASLCGEEVDMTVALALRREEGTPYFCKDSCQQLDVACSMLTGPYSCRNACAAGAQRAGVIRVLSV